MQAGPDVAKHSNRGSVWVFAALLLSLGIAGCSGDNKTGLWIRLASPEVPIDQVVLNVFDQADDSAPITQSEVIINPAQTFDPSPLSENPLWILILTGPDHIDSQILILAKGSRDGREVCEGSLENLAFQPNRIEDAPVILLLNAKGADDDQDGFFVPDDCDDNNDQVHPEQTEFCADETDNNCDGTIDEGCPCETPVAECWPDWADEPLGGPCTKGTQACINGRYGPCDGLKTPDLERCQGDDYDCFECMDTIDNDCDGFVDTKDTDCGGCQVGTWATCYTGPDGTAGTGICQFGQALCLDGSYGVCENEVTPNGWDGTPDSPDEENLCNDRDDDCDGTTDNVTVTPSCTNQCGVCAGASQACAQGAWVDCVDSDYLAHAMATQCDGTDEPRCCQAATPDCYVTVENTELCDYLDNDCNCQLDDAFDGQCTCETGDTTPCPDGTPNPNEGECIEGVFNCIGGQWIQDAVCVGTADELCDNLDNDCDSQTDRSPLADAHCMQNPQANAELSGCFDGECRWNCNRDTSNQQIAWDLNGDRDQPGGSTQGDGCEYLCVLSIPADEICDGQDNDCDGLTDGDDDSAISVLCPDRNDATATACIADQVCDYTCNSPFGDCDPVDLGDPVPLPGQPAYAGNGCETNLNTDPDHCGLCNLVCDSQELCVAANCSCGGSGPDCTWPDICCGNLCYDSQVDEAHCGTCTTTCDANEFCVGGGCSCDGNGPDCTGAQNNFCCDSNCRNLNTDENYCGNCNTQCDTNETCQSGSCSCSGSGPDCAGSQTNFCCNGNCRNLNTDESYCGNCNTQCDMNESCVSGLCLCGGSGPDCTGAATDTCCGTQCVDTTTDSNHCNGCNQACGAHQHCTGSTCVCDAGWADCIGGSNGCETPLGTMTDCQACGDGCNDGNLCTNDSCGGGGCQNVNNTDSCNDGDNCTYNDTCSGGNCDGTTITCTSDQCTTRTCNGTSNCTINNLGSSTACDDGNDCSHTDRCNGAGSCVGIPIGCTDDPGACGANRSCNGSSSCTVNYPGSSTSCDDGADCTYNDDCDGSGGCGGTPISCTDEPTTCGANRSCNGSSSCTVNYPGGGTTCDDSNLCTYNDACNGSGSCTGTTVTCNDDPTTCGANRACNGSSSCTVTFPDGSTSCNDLDPCTYNDDCNGLGACTGTSVTCNDDPGVCDIDRACNGSSTCTETYPGGGTSCDDSDLCTHTDVCDGGGGCAGTGITCDDDLTTCGADRSCNGSASCTVTYPGGATGCNDGDACTNSDVCNGSGGCSGTPMTCDPNESCVGGLCLCGGSGPECGGTPDDYCCGFTCVDTTSNNTHCSDCFTPCAANEQCAGSTCDCVPGYGDCNGGGDGCEQQLNADPHCGACNNNCSTGTWDQLCVLDTGVYRCGCNSDNQCDEGGDPAHDTCNFGQQICQ